MKKTVIFHGKTPSEKDGSHGDTWEDTPSVGFRSNSSLSPIFPLWWGCLATKTGVWWWQCGSVTLHCPPSIPHHLRIDKNTSVHVCTKITSELHALSTDWACTQGTLYRQKLPWQLHRPLWNAACSYLSIVEFTRVQVASGSECVSTYSERLTAVRLFIRKWQQQSSSAKLLSWWVFILGTWYLRPWCT